MQKNHRLKGPRAMENNRSHQQHDVQSQHGATGGLECPSATSAEPGDFAANAENINDFSTKLVAKPTNSQTTYSATQWLVRKSICPVSAANSIGASLSISPIGCPCTCDSIVCVASVTSGPNLTQSCSPCPVLVAMPKKKNKQGAAPKKAYKVTATADRRPPCGFPSTIVCLGFLVRRPVAPCRPSPRSTSSSSRCASIWRCRRALSCPNCARFRADAGQVDQLGDR